MPGIEIAFTQFSIAPQAAFATPAANPTLRVPTETGIITPVNTYARPEETTGTLAQLYRQKRTDKRGEVEMSGPLDLLWLARTAAGWLNGAFSSTGVSVGGSTVGTYNYGATRAMTNNNLLFYTAWFGDPNVYMWQADDMFFEELVIDIDASDEEGIATMEVSAVTKAPTEDASFTPAAITKSALLAAGHAQIFVDLASGTPGTTAYTTDLVSASMTIPTGRVAKKTGQGPGEQLTYTRTGIGASSPELEIALEWNETLYNHYDNQDDVVVVVRLNGDLIETALAVDYYNYVQFAFYGKLEFDSFDENGDTNQTMSLMLVSEYNTTLASDLDVDFQLSVATL